MASQTEPLPAGQTPAAKKTNIDPVIHLREFITAKKKVSFQDDWLDFDGYKVHRSAQCGLRLNKGSPLIDIGSVWYMFYETSADRTYTQASASMNAFTYIGIDRRGDLCDFLLGRTSTCLGLVKDVIEGRKRPRDKAPRQSAKVDGAESTLGDSLSYEDVTKRVRAVQDLDVVIRRPGRLVPNANMILKIAQEEWQAFSTGTQKVTPLSKKKDDKVPFFVELEAYLEKDEKNLPIVLVPCNKNAPVNLLNVRELLQDGTWSKPDAEHTKFFESTRQAQVQVTRHIGGKRWTFEVHDTTKNFTKEQWLRTVLVITDGNEWQFKGWPFENVVDLFCTMRGVYFKEVGKNLPVHVADWPCMKLPMPNASNGHRTQQLRDDIFKDLEDFMHTTRVKKFTNHSAMTGGRRTIVVCKDVL